MADVTTLGMAVDSSGVVKASDDLDRMTKSGEGAAMSALEVEIAMTKAAAAGDVIGQAIGKIVTVGIDLVKTFVDLTFSIGEYQDIAEKIGSNDPAGLASLRASADVTGTSIDSVAMAINRMALQLSKADESKTAGKALAAINLDIEEFKNLDPVEQYKALAKALDGYGDSQKKVQVIQAITGRGGAEQLAMLKELGGETEHATFLTNAQIREADAYTDAMKRSASETRMMIAAIGAEGLLPVLSVATKTFSDATKEVLGFNKEMNGVEASSAAVRAFAQNIALTFADVGDYIHSTTSEFQKFRAMWEFASSKSPMSEAIQKLKSDLAAVDATWTTTLRKRLEDNFKLDEAARASKAAAAAAGNGGDGKPEIDPNLDLKNDKLAHQRDEYGALIIRIQEKLAIEQREFDSGKKITESEKQRIEVYAAINKFKTILNATQMDAIDAILLETEALRKNNDEQERTTKWLEESAKQTAVAIENARSRRDSDKALAERAEESLALYGATAEIVARVEVAKLRLAAADVLARKNLDDFNPSAAEQNRILDEQAAYLNRVADAKERVIGRKKGEEEDPLKGAEGAIDDYVKKVNSVGAETKRAASTSLGMLEDDILDLTLRGKDNTKALVDFMIQEFLRLAIVRPMLASLFGGAGTGGVNWLGMITGVLGLFGGGGGGLAVDTGGMGTNTTGGSLPTAGGAAFGGDVDPFSAKQVNERGPELATLGGKTFLMTGDKGGTITPADQTASKLGNSLSVTLAPTIYIDSRSDAAQVRSSVQQAIGESQKALLEELHAQGIM